MPRRQRCSHFYEVRVPLAGTKVRYLTKNNLILCPTQLLPNGRWNTRTEPLQIDAVADRTALVSGAPRNPDHLLSYGIAVSQVEMSQIEGRRIGPTGGPATRAILTR
jgi:hypothetical protein